MAARIAVVTGASGTLGSILVSALAQRGLAVLAVSRSGRAPDAGEVASLAVDLGRNDAIDQIRAGLPDGELAMAVHSVGLPAAPGVASVDPALLGDAVNLKAGGFLRLIRAVDDRVVAGSRMVGLAGHLGIEPTEQAPLSGVANAALANLVRQLVGPVGRLGGSVHLVAPGPFESGRIDAIIAARAAALGVSDEHVRAEILAEYPSGRMPTAQDVAWAITTLLEPGASAMHGSTIFLDGGVRRGIF